MHFLFIYDLRESANVSKECFSPTVEVEMNSGGEASVSLLLQWSSSDCSSLGVLTPQVSGWYRVEKSLQIGNDGALEHAFRYLFC